MRPAAILRLALLVLCVVLLPARAAVPDGGQVVLAAWADGWAPDPILSVSEWADKHRRLSSKGAAEPGPWRTARVPFLREILDVLSDHHPAREVVLMKCTQVGGTEIGLNWVGYTIDNAPGPMLCVLPTIDVAEKWSKQRLAAMIEESPRLRGKVAPARSRDSGNTTLVKEFDGGLLVLGGANSAASLSSMPIRKLLLDEVDRFPLEIEDEGDPVDLAEARQTAFANRKTFKISSPTVESLSRINKDWKRSDQRRYYVPCPDCNELQVLKFDNLRWPEGHPDQARYACEHCGSLVAEHHKTSMLAGGQWRATFPERGVVGFHVNGLYIPPGLGRTWAEIARRYEEVRRDPVRFKVFTNTILGECYEDPNERLDWEEIKSRAEAYQLRTIPRGCHVLTAGVDVQKDRLELTLLGWGRNEAAWVLDHLVLPGDPTRPEVWADLDAYLGKPIRNAAGIDRRIAAVAVDSGYLTDQVLNYTRARKGRNVFATKGASDRGRTILGRPNKVDFRWNGTTHKHGAEIWLVGVDSAKHALFARLASDRKAATPADRHVHFSAGLSDDWFMQLTAEVYDPNKRRWVKIANRRNEALDTLLLASVAARHPRVRVHMMREHEWAELDRVLEPAAGDLFAASTDGGEAAPPAAGPSVASSGSPLPAPDADAAVQTDAAASTDTSATKPERVQVAQEASQPVEASAPASRPPAPVRPVRIGGSFVGRWRA